MDTMTPEQRHYAMSRIRSTENRPEREIRSKLHGYGFRYFTGVSNGSQWGLTTAGYARQMRTLVTAANLADHPEWFEGMFDAATVLSAERG